MCRIEVVRVVVMKGSIFWDIMQVQSAEIQAMFQRISEVKISSGLKFGDYTALYTRRWNSLQHYAYD
jgi:hypothetical protein